MSAPTPTYPSLKDYFETVSRWRNLLVLVCVIGMVTAALVAIIPKRRYEAGASFVPGEGQQAPAGGLGRLAAQFAGIGGAGGQSLQFYTSLLRSRAVLRDVVLTRYATLEAGSDSVTLVQFFDTGTDSLATTGGLASPVLKAMRRLDERLSVAIDEKAGMITYSVELEDPLLTRAVSERLLELVNRYNRERRQSQARAEREFMDGRLGVAKDNLRRSEQAQTDFLSRNADFRSSPRLSAAYSRIQREVSMHEQLVTTLSERYESARLEEVRNTPVISVVVEPAATLQPRPRRLATHLIAGLSGGLFLGLFAAFVLEALPAGTTAPAGLRRLRR